MDSHRFGCDLVAAGNTRIRVDLRQLHSPDGDSP